MGSSPANQTKKKVKVTQLCLTLLQPHVARQAPLSMEFPQGRMLEWVAISFSRGSFYPGTEPGSPALQADSQLSEPPGKPNQRNLYFNLSS